jgi:hypothetical protein
MKKSILLSVVFFFAIVLCGGTARAQMYDSLTVDNVLSVSPPDLDTTAIIGPPDSRQMHLVGSSDFVGVQFEAGGPPVIFHKGDSIHFFWIRETTDSNGADIQFLYQDPNTGIPSLGPIVRVIESGPIDISHETTIIVPDTGFNTLSIFVAADSGCNSCYVDAISLIQMGTASVAATEGIGAPALSNYPNPFYSAYGTTVSITSAVQGNGTLRIYDVLGNEVAREPVGELTEGEQDVRVALNRAGIFFARLYVDGAPNGLPLKITSE